MPTVYEIVTEKILTTLDAGVAPWRLPWSRADEIQRSAASGKEYRGCNIWLLTLAQMAGGYESPTWLTYKQATERGGQVRKGEKSTLIVFWKFLDGTDGKKIPMLRYYNVFNAQQCDGIPYTRPEHYPVAPVTAAQDIIDALQTRHPFTVTQGNRASYSPSLDTLEMPSMDRFPLTEDYYASLFHELAHWTGHSDRLDRTLSGDRSEGSYAKEELIAELTAAYLCGHCGIIDRTIEQTTAYLSGWSKRLRQDPRLFVSAASQAQRACDFILGKTFAESEPVLSTELAAV